MKHNVTRIGSVKHNVYTIQSEKVVLTSFYDKMYMIDNINCYPHGYKNVNYINE